VIAAFALLLAFQTTVPNADAPRADDIVVRDMRKLEEWRGVLVFQRDTPDCRVVTSANDKDLDAIGCASMVQCFVTTKPRFLALNDRKLSARARRQQRVAATRDMDACFKTTRMAMVQDLTRRREAAAAAAPAG